MDLSKLKSAVVLEKFEDIERAFKERAKNFSPSSAQRGKSITLDGESKTVKLHSPTGSRVTGKELKLLSDADLERRAAACGIKWTREMAGRTIPYWMSDERPDAHGDIVLQNWRFNLFDKNPVMCDTHDWSGHPIGVMVTREVKQRVDVDYRGAALYGDSLYAPPSVSEEADAVYRLAEAGFLKACSVGFVSNKVIDVKDDDERAALGLGRWGYILDENDLLELSPCTLGANPGAHQAKSLQHLVAAKQRGAIGAKELQVLREIARAEGHKLDPDAVLREDARLLAYGRALFPKSTFVPLKDVDQSLLDPEMREKDRRLWVNIQIVSEDTGETSEPDGDETVDEGTGGGMMDGEDDPQGMAARRSNVHVREGSPKTVEEKLDALAAMVEETLVSFGEGLAQLRSQLQELSEKICDDEDDDKKAADHGGSADDDEDAKSSVEGGLIRKLGAQLDRARAAVHGS